MNNKFLTVGLLALAVMAQGCGSHYQLESVSRSRILIDSRYDAHPDAEAAKFLAPYTKEVDSIMGPMIGEVDHYMAVHQPESDISDLLADIMVWAGKHYNEKPDMGLYNMGGIRAALSKGKVTYGDILNVAPFENKICFLTLSGNDLMQLFREIASQGGQGVSHGVELVITKDGKLISAKLNGKEIDPNGKYRIATIDYLAQGNDYLLALTKGTDVVAPKEPENDTRYIITDYFKEQNAQGKVVNAKVEGRIIVK